MTAPLQHATVHAPRPVGDATLGHSLAVQARVVRALLLRELITRFGRRNLGVLWLIVEPTLFTLGVAALWTLAGRELRSAIPIIAFAITGYSTVMLWRNTVSHNLNAIQQNLNLLFHRNVRLIDVFAARTLLELAGATASFALLCVVFIGIGWIKPPEDLLTVIAGWALLAWFGGALGLLMGAGSAFTELLQRFWQPISYVLFPLSGAAFMVDWLPRAAQDAVLLLPMVHAVEMIREGYFGQVVRTYHDAGFVVVVNLALTGFGLVLLRLAATRVENR